jgi:hypothetical protein
MNRAVRIGKLSDPASVTRSRELHDLESPFPARETLIIDTTHMSPVNSARRIIDHFGLTRLFTDLEND